MPSFLIKILKFISNRIDKFGAQYSTFALFGLLNYPISYLFSYKGNEQDNVYLVLRLVPAFLCAFLLFHKKWPERIKKLLPLYWYITLVFSIPVIGTYMFFAKNFSLDWAINFNIGIIILILLVDWLSFIIIEVTGAIIGICLYLSQYDTFPALPSEEVLSIFIYLFSCIVILIPIFSRNKEQFNLKNLKDRDILNRALEQEVEMRTKELTKALAVKTEFLNNISHEIKTPIAAFSMAAESLVEDWNRLDNKKRFAMASLVAGAALRIKNLAMHLIDATKFQNSADRLLLQQVSLSQLIRDFIDEADMLYTRDKNIKINFNSSENCDVNADPEAITQVLRNLVINAIKFSPNDSIITICLEKSKGEIKTTISDQGIGIPSNELTQIFTPFYQSSKTKTGAGGVGLGLNIAKRIIESHHGNIWAKNNKGGKGASIIFTLPEAQQLDHHEANNKKGVVLVIDDEPDMLSSIELTLSNKTRHSILTADSGEKGLDILNKAQKVDLVLLDIMMPGIDGFEVLKIIRKQWPQVKVIMQSGINDKEAGDKAIKLGAIAFLAKPYKATKLLEQINENL
jgi:signal transduction histidine kinase/CheY-like chemotaxis protein